MSPFLLGLLSTWPIPNQDEEQEEDQGQEQEQGQGNQQQIGPKNPPEDNGAWGLWPEPQQEQEVNMGPNLNVAPMVEEEMEIDLN